MKLRLPDMYPVYAFNYIMQLNISFQLSIIKKLREEQGVERPKAKAETPQTSPSELDILREKVDKANREIKIADNKHSETKTDASVKRKEID